MCARGSLMRPATVATVKLGFWPGDFGFQGANSVVAVTVCSIARISRSIGSRDVKHPGLRQAHDLGDRSEAAASSGKGGGLLTRSPRVVRRAGKMSQLSVSC